MKKLLLAVLLLLSFSVNAEMMITTLNASWHYSDTKDYNETHHGIGIEYNNFGYVRYNNSHNKTSNMFYYKDHVQGNFYVAYGLASGYESPLLVGLMYKAGPVRFLVSIGAIAVGLEIPIADIK